MVNPAPQDQARSVGEPPFGDAPSSPRSSPRSSAGLPWGGVKEHVARYSRQLLLKELGVPGQATLRRTSILIIGAGGLGSPCALYLAAAGVGRLGIVDPDVVALSDLHRQILYTTAEVGQGKSRVAAGRLAALNPDTTVIPLQERLTTDNAFQLLEDYDLIVDGSDNLPTRYLVNDACVLRSKPLVHGAAIQWGGQVMTVLPQEGACFRCVFPEPPRAEAMSRCQDAGVLGSVVGVIGSLMAQEALKVAVGVGEQLVNRLLVFDGMTSRFREVTIRRDLGCAVCGESPSIRTLQIEGELCGSTGFNREVT